MERPLALVVDKDPAARAVIRAVFEEHDIAAIGAASLTEVTEALRTQPIRFIVIDCDTPGVDALEIIRHGTSLTPEPIVPRTGQPRNSRAIIHVLGGASSFARWNSTWRRGIRTDAN